MRLCNARYQRRMVCYFGALPRGTVAARQLRRRALGSTLKSTFVAIRVARTDCEQVGYERVQPRRQLLISETHQLPS